MRGWTPRRGTDAPRIPEFSDLLGWLLSLAPAALTLVLTISDDFRGEIQTEERNLTTLPNLFLVTNPVTTLRSSGTFVSATVSLGYDVPRGRIEELLVEAAGRAELEDPFVTTVELGDFSVTYRIAGMLTEIKSLITARSRRTSPRPRISCSTRPIRRRPPRRWRRASARWPPRSRPWKANSRVRRTV